MVLHCYDECGLVILTLGRTGDQIRVFYSDLHLVSIWGPYFCEHKILHSATDQPFHSKHPSYLKSRWENGYFLLLFRYIFRTERWGEGGSREMPVLTPVIKISKKSTPHHIIDTSLLLTQRILLLWYSSPHRYTSLSHRHISPSHKYRFPLTDTTILLAYTSLLLTDTAFLLRDSSPSHS